MVGLDEFSPDKARLKSGASECDSPAMSLTPAKLKPAMPR
jgi:hypothetical protein